MTHAPRRILFTIVAALCAAFAARAEADIPLLTGRVTDNAGILSPETAARISTILKTHEDSTSNQVAVLTIPSLEGEVLETYSMRVAEAWKLGRKGTDNGVLLLIARDDRKVRIEVGRGLEGNLPDITCGLIIRNVIVPHFKSGDYDGGVSAGVDAIVAALQGSYTPPEETPGADIGTKLMAGGIFTVVVGLFTLIVLFARGPQSWFLYFFLLPFWLVFPMAIVGVTAGIAAFACYAILVPCFRLWTSKTAGGKSLYGRFSSMPFFSGMSTGGSGSSWSSGGGSSGSSDSGFSGGGGGFSGGGASGGW
jgi:uncharacterized protein